MRGLFVRLLVACACALTTMRSVSRADVVDFDLTVLPILTQAGCNSGACHGAAAGRGGFRLSLYGQNPEQDWERITREIGGRRIHLADPEQSLILRKAGEFIEHGGGEVLDPASEHWQRVLTWIDQGATRRDDVQVERLRIEPQSLTLRHGENDTASLKVYAELNNGESLDVTRFAIAKPHDPGTVRTEIIDNLASDGVMIRVQVTRPGRYVLMVRFRDHISAAEVMRPFAATQRDIHSTAVQSAGDRIVDQAINERLSQLNIVPLQRADDLTLLRRVTLDLVGRIPSEREIEEFLRAPPASRYDDRVTRLLQSEEWTRYWSVWLSQNLRANTLATKVQGKLAGEQLAAFFQQRLSNNPSVSTLLTEVVASDGLLSAQPTGVYYQLGGNGRERAEVFSEVMLGTRMRCANCHDHPLDVWTQDDYHGLAALLAGVRVGDAVTWKAGSVNMHPGTGGAAVPTLPDGTEVSADIDPRPALAQWLSEAGRNPLARNWCNRVWSELMGEGLVNPVDDHRVTNPSWQPALLDSLVASWLEQGGDLKWLLREITLSDAYCRATVEPETDNALQAIQSYAGRARKPLRTAVYLDALADVTGIMSLETASDERRFAHRVYLNEPDGRTRVAEGCTGNEVCETDFNDSLAGRLASIAGPLVNARIESNYGTIAERRSRLTEDLRGSVSWLLQQCFSRPADAKSVEFWCAELAQADDLEAAWNDLVWAMLTSERFRTNW